MMPVDITNLQKSILDWRGCSVRDRRRGNGRRAIEKPNPKTAEFLLPGRANGTLGRLATFFVTLVFILAAPHAFAVSCTTQSQMKGADRDRLSAAATRIAGLAAAGNTASLRAATLPSVAAQFDAIAATVDALAPTLRGAAVTVENLYALHAEDLKPSDDEAQFYCSVPGSPLLITISIPQLPAGNYALAIVHATGVAKPQQFGLILAQSPVPSSAPNATISGDPGLWLLAGFFARPLTIADHDGIWYWSHARDLARADQRWSAYFYYQSAQFLLTPVDFLASPNLAKLQREEAAVRPEGLPGESSPTMTVAGGDQSFTLTSLRTDGALGGLDLVLHYNANAVSVDPVFSRSQALTLMSAMLQQHPELRANFHGLWVYADSPGRQPFAVELPMNQIH